jgi:SAM-dependent methyltransferase
MLHRAALLSLLLRRALGGSLQPAKPCPKQYELDIFGGDALLPNGTYEVSSWAQVRALPIRRLNFGGGLGDKHPNPKFRDFVAVENDRTPAEANATWFWCTRELPHCGSNCVCYDPRRPFPLDDESVDQVLSEHALEHIDAASVAQLFAEFHRVLKPGGWVRVSVPDYGHPVLRGRVRRAGDRRVDGGNEKHVALTTYGSMKALADASPFGGAVFYQYFDDVADAEAPAFYQRADALDDARGYLKRLPWRSPRGARRDVAKLRHGTSVVFDLVKRRALPPSASLRPARTAFVEKRGGLGRAHRRRRR